MKMNEQQTIDLVIDIVGDTRAGRCVICGEDSDRRGINLIMDGIENPTVYFCVEHLREVVLSGIFKAKKAFLENE